MSSDESERPCCLCWGTKCNCGCMGSCSCSQNGVPMPSCVFYSSRIQGLYEGESTEFETATEHWTEVDSSLMEEVERIGEENNKYFNEVLVKHPKWGAFFTGFEDLQVGKKIGEGGQAEIFEATTQRDMDLVAKIFKKEVSLIDLERHWPPQMMFGISSKVPLYSFVNVLGGAFIRDGDHKNRYAFVMCRRWGDLRTLLDQCMVELLHKNNHEPPLKKGEICILIRGVLMDLMSMHEVGLVHRDIKAANVLIDGVQGSSLSYLNLMDFECSLGTLGIGFWRAPEILEQVQ